MTLRRETTKPVYRRYLVCGHNRHSISDWHRFDCDSGNTARRRLTGVCGATRAWGRYEQFLHPDAVLHRPIAVHFDDLVHRTFAFVMR